MAKRVIGNPRYRKRVRYMTMGNAILGGEHAPVYVEPKQALKRAPTGGSGVANFRELFSLGGKAVDYGVDVIKKEWKREGEYGEPGKRPGEDLYGISDIRLGFAKEKYSKLKKNKLAINVLNAIPRGETHINKNIKDDSTYKKPHREVIDKFKLKLNSFIPKEEKPYQYEEEYKQYNKRRNQFDEKETFKQYEKSHIDIIKNKLTKGKYENKLSGKYDIKPINIKTQQLQKSKKSTQFELRDTPSKVYITKPQNPNIQNKSYHPSVSWSLLYQSEPSETPIKKSTPKKSTPTKKPSPPKTTKKHPFISSADQDKIDAQRRKTYYDKKAKKTKKGRK